MAWDYEVNLRGNIQLSKEINKLTVLNLIRKSKAPISRADITRITGLTNPTISSLVAELMEENLVVEVGLGETVVGRRPMLLDFNPGGRAIAGVVIDYPGVTIGITDLGGKILAKKPIDVNLSGGARPEVILQKIGQELKAFIEEWEMNGPEIWGTGVALTGGVNGRTGMCIESRSLNWINVPVKELLEPWARPPLHVANNIRCMILGEKWFGVAQGARDIVGIRFGKRVGSGIIIDDNVLEGSRGMAGEIGHLTVDPNGMECFCGNRGCLRNYVTEDNILRRLILLTEDGDEDAKLLATKLKDIQSGFRLEFLKCMAEDGHELSERIMYDLVRYLGFAIANLIKSFNPTLVVLLNEDKPFAESLAKEITLTVDPLIELLSNLSVDIVAGQLGEDAHMVGASALVLDGIFKTSMV